MAYFFLVLGIVSLLISAVLFNNDKQSPPVSQPLKPAVLLKDNKQPLTVSQPLKSESIEPEKPKLENPPTNPNKEKGDQFEDFVIQTLATLDNSVKLISQASDYHKNGISAEENKEPDLKFTLQTQAFAVECKWRQNFDNEGKITWAKDYQIANYNKFQSENKQKVLIAIGIGGSANAPEKLYLVPLYRLTKGIATENYIADFQVSGKKATLALLQKELVNRK